MGEWLSTTIQNDLGKVIQSDHVQPNDPLHRVFEDDGSNIRVKLSKPGIVQLVKWEKYAETFQAWVSDSVIRLKATFASEAAIQHENKTGRRLTEGTLGNIIQLNDAEVVATHLGPSTSKITLFVSKFKVIGSDTSAEIGSPRPFDATPEFSQLLVHLSAFRKPNGRDPALVKSIHNSSPISPRRASFTPINDPGNGSQQLFSQVPAQFRNGTVNENPQRRRLTGRRLSEDTPEAEQRSMAVRPINQNEALLELMKAKSTRVNTENQSLASKAAVIQTPLAKAVIDTHGESSPKLEITRGGPNALTEVASRPLIEPSINGKKEIVKRSNKASRIRSQELRISKAQQDLLDSDDSWLPAKPGQRAPVANLPHTVLEHITQSVEARNIKCPSSPGEEKATKSLNSKESHTAETPAQDAEILTPEIPVSSGEWPSSSPVVEPRYELPPDSSMEVCSESDREIEEQPSECASVLGSNGASPSRRDSAASSRIGSWAMTDEPVPSQLEAASQQHRLGDRNDLLSPHNEANMSASTTQSQTASQAPFKEDCEPASSDHDSDLETQIPLKLQQQEAPVTNIMSTQEVPATAIQPEEPVLQVKRTPYVDQIGHGHQGMMTENHTARVHYLSPSKRRRLNDFETLNSPTHRADDPRKDGKVLSGGSSPRAVRTNQPSSNASSQEIDETALGHDGEGDKGEIPSKSLFEHVSGTEDPLSSIPAEFEAREDTSSTHEQQASPRRKATSPVLSPPVSKRRKVGKAALRFDFSQDECPMEDPAITARRQREEFMASRKNSRTMSLTSPHDAESGRPATPLFNKTKGPLVFKEEGLFSAELASTSGRHDLPDNTLRTSGGSSASNAGEQSPDVANPKDLVRHSDLAPFGQSSQVSMLPDAREAEFTSTLDTPIITSQEHDLLLTQSLRSDAKFDPTSPEAGAQSSAKTSQQTTNSGHAQSIPELMTPAMSVSEMRQSNSPSLTALSAPHGDQPQLSIFQQFKSAYTDYAGTEEHFLGMCRKIRQLLQADRMEHKSLWDDFVIRHKTDYPLYLQRCLEAAKDAKSYERFYRDEIDEPKYSRRILQPILLDDVLKADPQTSVVEKLDLAIPASNSESNTVRPDQFNLRSQHRLLLSSPVRNGLSTTSGEGKVVEPDKPSRTECDLGSQSTPYQPSKPHGESSQPRDHGTPSPKRETIDLTGEGSSSPEPKKSPIPRRISLMQPILRTPRKIPWQEDEAASQLSARRELRSENNIIIESPREGNAVSSPPTATPSRGRTTSAHKQSAADTMTIGLSKPSQTLRSELKKLPSEDEYIKLGSAIPTAATARSKPAINAPTNARQMERRGSEVDEWWKDENTPFREFVRCYRGIKPGNGNAWAQEMDKERKKEERPERRPKRGGEASKRLPFDVNNWYI
ncbi:MAG: hypothetical protein Q9220_001583 [cf. Caloplaca sp. 1 TL-2023]